MASHRLAFVHRGLQPPPHVQQSLAHPSPVMHSSEVRDEDFSVTDGGTPRTLQKFLPHISRLSRVGVVAPETGTEAAGAAALILAMITAFYDDLRAGPDDFFAYPDFFVFQPAGRPSPAPYSMFDIWPSHKWVSVEGDKPIDWLRAVTDRGVDVLLVPEGRGGGGGGPDDDWTLRFNSTSGEPEQDAHAKLALHSASRLISDCWVYSPSGHVSCGAEVTVAFDPRGAFRSTLCFHAGPFWTTGRLY